MECDCGHIQCVGRIMCGQHSSFPDPDTACKKCGKKGKFSGIGSKKAMEEFMAKMSDAHRKTLKQPA